MLICLLQVSLASLYPLTAGEIRDAVRSRFVVPPGGLALELERVMELVGGLLLRRRDGTYAFFHSTFRDWLMRREDNEGTKFLCELRYVVITMFSWFNGLWLNKIAC